MRKILLSSIVASLVVSAASVAVWSQQDSSAPGKEPSSSENTPTDVSGIPAIRVYSNPPSINPQFGPMGTPWGLNLPTPFSAQDQADLKKFVDMIAQLRGAKDETVRQKVLEDIREEVARQFDKDVSTRQQELDRIEQRLIRIRTQLEASRANRETNINTIVNMIENPNAGLGLRREWIDAIVNQSNTSIGTNVSISGDAGMFENEQHTFDGSKYYSNKTPSDLENPKTPTYPSAADYNQPATLNNAGSNSGANDPK